MAGSIKHRYQSGAVNTANPDEVGSTRWNDSFVMAGGNAWEFARRDTVAADGWSLERPSTVYDARAYGVVAGTGANMTAQLQAACDAAAASDLRAAVRLPPGVTHVVGLDLSEKPLTILGHNRDATILRRFSDTDHLIKITNAAQKTGWVFQDVRIDGNSSTTWDGISCTNVVLSSFLRTYFTRCRYGLHLSTGSVDNGVFDCVFGSANVNGLRISSSGTNIFHRVIGNWFNENSSIGLYCNSTDLMLVGNIFLENAGTHLFLDVNASRNHISSNKFRKGTATNNAINCYGDANFIACNDFEKMTSTDLLFQTGADTNKFWWNDIPATFAITNTGTGNAHLRPSADGQLLMPALGSSATPDLAYENDLDTGLRRSASNEQSFVNGASIALILRSTLQADFQGAVRVNGNVGFYNTAPAAKPTVTGSRGGNAALASLLTALAGLGLLTDSSS